jgi:hypothetical protein
VMAARAPRFAEITWACDPDKLVAETPHCETLVSEPYYAAPSTPANRTASRGAGRQVRPGSRVRLARSRWNRGRAECARSALLASVFPLDYLDALFYTG